MQTNVNVVNQIKSLIEDNIPQWYSIKDAVRISGLSESSIRRALYSAKCRGNKVGGKWIVRASWLEKFLTS